MKRAGILFTDFGPYHVARIEALREALGQRGIELVAFRFTERSDDYGWTPEDPKGVPVVTLAQRKPSGALDAFKMAATFARELRDRKIEAVFLPTYSPLPNLLCFLAAKAAGCRAVLMTESWRGTEGASPPGNLIKHVLVRMFDSALVGGSPQRDYVVAYGMQKEKVFVGYDVVDVEHFAQRAEEFRKRSDEWRVTSDESGQSDVGDRGSEIGSHRSENGGLEVLMRSLPERFFLNLGRFVEKKNLSTLVEAYARFARASGERSKAETGNLNRSKVQIAEGKPEVPETTDGVDAAATSKTRHPAHATRHRPASLVLVGEGPLRGDLERRARDSGLVVRDGVADPNPSGGAEVVFYPFQQADVTPLFFARCEAFVLPSTREEWGLVVNEAMACGAPVIVSNRVGSHFNLVQEGVNGFSFDPSSTSELANLLGRFEVDEDLRGRFGAAGRRIIEDWQPSRFGEGGLQALKAAGVLAAS